MHKKLIVFDIDGTLLQSIATHQLAMTQAMAASSLVHRDPEWSNYVNHTDSGVLLRSVRNELRQTALRSRMSGFRSALPDLL